MKFLANENFPVPSIKLLRKYSQDVTAIIEGQSGISDNKVLSIANSEKRIILTFDSDYGEMIYRLSLPAPYGIIYFRFNPQYAEEPGDILLNLLKNNEILLDRKFTILYRDRLRQRALP